MPDPGQPLIVGAGPVGLAAALFLAREGIPARVVEMRAAPSSESRALAVNPRTLEILAPTGVTARMLEIGRPMRGARFHRRGRHVATLSFDGIHPQYPFLLALSQAATERLLEAALEEAGGAVERGRTMVACRNLDDSGAAGDVEVTIEPAAGGAPEISRHPWMLGADGARSTVRAQLGFEFPGSSFKRPWYLADVPLRTALASDHGHVFFEERGAFLFMIRVIDPALPDDPAPTWRLISNRPAPLSRLREAEQAGEPVWESEFGVSHRIVRTMAAGAAYLAGDAAHIHSPIGARGMNLGIEDAWVFARLAAAGRLAEYDRLRRPVDGRVVRRVELLSRVAAAEPGVLRLARLALPMALRIAPIRARMRATGAGLDHPLPRIDDAS